MCLRSANAAVCVPAVNEIVEGQSCILCQKYEFLFRVILSEDRRKSTNQL